MLRRPLAALLIGLAFGGCTELKVSRDEEADGGMADAGDAVDASAADASVEADAGVAADAGCTPSCALRACGPDPVCGISCGACASSEACVVGDAGASCRAATIAWVLDGNIVAQHATHEIFASSGFRQIFLPYYGRNVTLQVSSSSVPGKISDCTAGTAGVLTVSSGDNGYAGLTALPSAWKGQVWSACGPQANGDTVLARDVILTANGPTRIAGTYELTVQGGGDRAGSVLKVRGAFDLTPPAP